MTAFELCGNYKDERFKLKKGRVIWQSISYRDGCDKCFVSRIVEDTRDLGGKPFFMGLRYKSAYINPETEVEIIRIDEKQVY